MGRPQVVEYLGSVKNTLQEPISHGALGVEVLTVENTKPTLVVEFDALLRCNEPSQQLSGNFAVQLRVDGQIIGGTRVQLTPYDTPYQRLHLSGIAENIAKGQHLVEVFFDAGGDTVIVMASPETPSFLAVYQA